MIHYHIIPVQMIGFVLKLDPAGMHIRSTNRRHIKLVTVAIFCIAISRFTEIVLAIGQSKSILLSPRKPSFRMESECARSHTTVPGSSCIRRKRTKRVVMFLYSEYREILFLIAYRIRLQKSYSDNTS